MQEISCKQFIDLLKKPEVQKEIQDIVISCINKERGNKATDGVDEHALTEEIKRTKQALEHTQSLCTELEQKNEEQQHYIEQLTKRLTAEYEKNTALQTEQQKLQAERQQLKHIIGQQQNELEVMKEKNTRLIEENKRQLEKNRQLTAELGERFDTGWRLYHQYEKLRADYRQQLSGVFVPERGFAGFICGGAQDDNLKTLWEVLRRSVVAGDTEEAALLGEIFEYARRLANSHRETELYVRLGTETGDAYDTDCHQAMKGSMAQGCVGEIYIDGYYNTYNKQIEGKSLVLID